MSFPRYPEYKASGVEWLGEVPGHWDVTALKRGFNVTLGKMLQPESSSPNDELLPYLRAANIQWGGVDTTDIKQMWLSKRDRVQLRLESGDLLVSEGGDVGRSCLWAAELDNCYFQNSVNRVRARDGHSNRYLYYWMSTIKDKGYIDVLCNKSTIAHFTAEKVAAVPVPLPNPAEQTQIAAFLDRETAKIDALVAEQRRLMVLLKEKRQAVISHAVTQGLNPDAPMKPSGIEWLGDVPAHWEVQKFKYLTRSIEQGWSPQCEGYPAETEAEWGVLKVGCVNGGIFRPSENKVLPVELEPIPALGIVRGDLLVSRANTRELVGSAAVAEQNYPRLMLCDKLYRLRFNSDRCSSVFACHYLGSTAVRGQIELGATGASASMVNIPQSAILELTIAVPPFKEQCEIVTALDSELAKLDTLTTEAQRAIDLLQERRTALISAAVTGQIDVRVA
ncbi:MAG TPA: restriction endonuclease subunit S [Halothiobacillus sp.]|nr:restriction endonuclease subunit S [Halothiobacillus sp.]